MARGWESKGVEAQRDEPLTGTGRAKRRTSPEAEERERKRSGLALSRRRVARELETARGETHRVALQNALDHLDAELANLDRSRNQ